MIKNKRYYYFFDDFNDIRRYQEGTDNDFAEVISILDLIEDANKLSEENKELKETLLDVLDQLYSSQDSLIYEYSTDISNDIKELSEYFKEKYSKYGWVE